MYWIVNCWALYISLNCFVYYVIMHAPRGNIINNIVSMQRPPYCIVHDDLYWQQWNVEKKKTKLYYPEIRLFILHLELPCMCCFYTGQTDRQTDRHTQHLRSAANLYCNIAEQICSRVQVLGLKFFSFAIYLHMKYIHIYMIMKPIVGERKNVTHSELLQWTFTSRFYFVCNFTAIFSKKYVYQLVIPLLNLYVTKCSEF